MQTLKSLLTAALSHLQAFCNRSFRGEVVLAAGVAGLVLGVLLF